MDYRTGPGPGAHELRGPLNQSLCVKSLLCISYLWLKNVYFLYLLMALIECTCAVLENVHVRQGHNYRQCSQHGRFIGRADPALYILNIWMSKYRKFNATVIKHDLIGTGKDTLCYIFPQNGKPVSVMVFIIFRGKSSVAIYNTIACLSYLH